MSRGPGSVMRAIEDYLDSLSPDQSTGYTDLARAAYGTQAPSRAQLSAISRAVDRLVHEGKAKRVLSGHHTDQPWYWVRWDGTRRVGGWKVRRKTVVFRTSEASDRASIGARPKGGRNKLPLEQHQPDRKQPARAEEGLSTAPVASRPSRTSARSARDSARRRRRESIGSLVERGDLAGARAELQRAVASRGKYAYAPIGWYELAISFARQNDVEAARVAYRYAMESRDDAVGSANAREVPLAAMNLGNVFGSIGHVADARAVYQHAIGSRHAQYAPMAALSLANLLREHGDLVGARVNYGTVMRSSHPQYAPEAAVNLGKLYEQEGDVENARVAYQHAIASGHADYAPKAAINLRNLPAGDATPGP